MVFFGTTQAADDLDSLRSALGLATLDVLGIGYGATLGAVYTDRYPGRVGRVVLDSPTDHSRPPSERAVSAATRYERAAEAFYADCGAQPACPLGSDPASSVADAVAALDVRRPRRRFRDGLVGGALGDGDGTARPQPVARTGCGDLRRRRRPHPAPRSNCWTSCSTTRPRRSRRA